MRVSERKPRSLPLEAVAGVQVHLVLENRAERNDRRGRPQGNRLLASANVSATRWVIYSFLAWRGERAAEPGRCQRGGSNDDLYPLLPVLLPTRDNTNHYHRLITGITANIEIMYACVYVCTYTRARARASKRMYVYACISRALQRVLLPPLFLPHHPLSFSLLFSLADPPPPPPHSIQRRCRRIIRDTGRGVSRGQVRCEPAPNEAQRAPPVIFLKDLSTGGKSGRRAG